MDRKQGGGRKQVNIKDVDLNTAFMEVINAHIAGDPTDSEIRWVKLTQAEIVFGLKRKKFKVGRNIVRKLLKKHKFVKRKMCRSRPAGKYARRDEQFKRIAALQKSFDKRGLPYFSIDTKKKESLGGLYREGKVYTTKAIAVYDHDYDYLAEGKVVPHGIYDIKENRLHLNLSKDNETAASVCYSIRVWWNTIGKNQYSYLPELLFFCDAGGANSYRHHIFKIELQALANDINIPIRIAHYPPYTSKWNLIEHRAFPYVTQAMEGVPLTSIEQVKDLTRKAKTATGLKTTVRIIKKKFKKGVRGTKEMVEKLNIFFDKKLPELNYLVKPEGF